MMKRAFVAAGSLLAAALLVSCVTASFDGPLVLGGVWSYTLTDTSGNTYDGGTIRFEGGDLSGTWTQRNLYDVEYSGTWAVDGVTVTVTGPETWKGRATGPDSLEGTWTKDNGDSGTWTARR